jgi:hypothetical protein
MLRRPHSPTGLYWSKSGEIACEGHSPEPENPRWTNERWCPMPKPEPGKARRYTCQHCSFDGRPLISRSRDTHSHY